MAAAGWGIRIEKGRVVGGQMVVTVRLSKWRKRWEILKACSRIRVRVGRGER